MAGLNCPRAAGVRYTPAFDWSPEGGALYFADRAKKLGDNMAWDELNMAEEAGQFFGFPLCHR
jgi:glucose/arabinose dehydrogenase